MQWHCVRTPNRSCHKPFCLKQLGAMFLIKSTTPHPNSHQIPSCYRQQDKQRLWNGNWPEVMQIFAYSTWIGWIFLHFFFPSPLNSTNWNEKKKKQKKSQLKFYNDIQTTFFMRTIKVSWKIMKTFKIGVLKMKNEND